MGKVKAKRSKFRAEPTGIPSVRAAQQECESKSSAPAGDSAAHPLVQQMEHEDANQREFACGALANIMADEQTAHNVLPVLMKADVLKKAVKCLSDAEPGVCAESAGLLSNIGLIGGPKACRTMLDAGVFPAAATLLRKSLESLAARENELDKHSKETILATAENAINLIWLLCETSDTALQHFAALSVLDLVIPCLDPARFPPGVVLAAAQCLQTVTEDNPLLCAALAQHPGCLQGLIQSASAPAVDGHSSLVRVVHAGTLYNMRDTIVGDTDVVAVCLAAIDDVLSMDGLALVAEALPTLSAAKAPAAGVFAKDDDQMGVEAVVDKVRCFLSAQQLALELLTNICTAEDDGDESGGWEDAGDGSDNDMAADGDDASLVSGADVAMATTSHVAGSLPSRLAATAILPSVLARCRTAPPHAYQVLASNQYGQAVRESVVCVQTRALASLNNLLMAHDDEERIIIALAPSNVWALLVEIAANRPFGVDTFAPDLLEQTLSTLWTLLRRLSQKPALASGLTVTEHEVSAVAGLGGSLSAQVRECVAGILGILAQHPGAKGSHKGIAEVLCVLIADPNLLVAAEALNSIYDAYAETDHNDAVRTTGMMPALEAALPALKQRFKEGRKSLDRPARGRVEDALVNLPRFIKYKRPQF